MLSAHFQIQEHAIPGQHIREYPRATLDEQEAVFRISVKQYTPLDNLDPKPGDVTLIAAHANGFPKELYEPLWEELHIRSKKHGFRIRGIWIADISNQGQSGVLNEELLGNDPSWADHPRDLLTVINHFRMPRPLMAMGHSFGGNQLLQLSLIHPRLLTSIVLLDPVVQREPSQTDDHGPTPSQLSTFRRDLWPSRDVAAASFRKNAFYKKWDPRVLDRWIKYGFRDLPTPLYPDSPATADPSAPTSPSTTPVTLTTTKHQEVFTFLRPNWDIDPNTGIPIDYRINVPDWDPTAPDTIPFYRPEPVRVFNSLPNIRPSVLWIFGGTSPVSPPKVRQEKLDLCGSGVGGSGGLKDGRVKGVTLEGIGHLVAMEAVHETADASSDWMASELKRWQQMEDQFRKEWAAKSRKDKTQLSEKYKELQGDQLKAVRAAVAAKKAKL